MIPYKSPLLTAVPQTLEKRLEIMNAIRALAVRDDALLRQRQAEIAAARRDFELLRHSLPGLLRQAIEEARRDCDLRLRSHVIKYSPDQPRVPAGDPDGGQWTSEGGAPADASDFADDEPDDTSGPGAQYAALDTGTQSDTPDGVPSNSQVLSDSSQTSQEMSGEVIYVCRLISDEDEPNKCIHWCENAGITLERQRNLGLHCPSLIVEPSEL